MIFEPSTICFHMIYISMWSYAWKQITIYTFKNSHLVKILDFDYVILKPACTATQTSEIYERTSMLKALVFPNYKYMIRIIWFCIVLTANTCSLHENQHYHMWSSMVYIKQAMASTLLWPLVLLLSHLILLKLFPYLRYLTLTFISDMMQIFENV